MRFWSVARPNCAGLANVSLSNTGMFSGMTSALMFCSRLTSSVLNWALSWDVNACSGVPLNAGVKPISGSNQTMTYLAPAVCSVCTLSARRSAAALACGRLVTRPCRKSLPPPDR
ncbi:hypothetical protein D3C76_1150030 [compost metagenome]